MATKPKDIGRILQEARTSRGFTQADIAPQLGVSRATIAHIETGRRSVKAEDLRRLAAFYGCNPSELLPGATDDEEADGVDDAIITGPDSRDPQVVRTLDAVAGRVLTS